jgi:hypothetical protein
MISMRMLCYLSAAGPASWTPLPLRVQQAHARVLPKSIAPAYDRRKAGRIAMHRLLSGLALVGALTVQQAQAQLQCLGPEERSAVEVAALRSELMVLATGCHRDDSYNAFIRKYQPDLVGNEKAVGDIFKRRFGRRAQQEHDRFTTDLANGESSTGMRLGTDFCERNGLIFAEVMALRGPNELAAYAAGKDLVPASLDVCPEVAQAPARKQSARR